MTLISATFILFLGLALLVYYLLPLNKRWYALLAASLIFYLSGGLKAGLFVLCACLAGYVCTVRIQRLYDMPEGEEKKRGSASDRMDPEAGKEAGQDAGQGGTAGTTGAAKAAPGAETAGTAATDPVLIKKRARRILTAGVVLVVAMLVVTKTGGLWVRALKGLSAGRFDLQVLVPLGISYYTFALAGYMADVYWKKDRAEKNFLRLLLYLIYFPHITQGPIPRHSRLSPMLQSGSPFDYERLCFGLQRMVWGFFKKSVAADRFAILTSAVFSGETAYPGCVSLLAVICSAFQLYFDFSGCMDIVVGVSECFGITLEENFARPFFSKSAAEFWRRWHITLGTWFKDYVYLPVSISPWLTRLSKRVKEKSGRKAARNVMTVIPLAVVWLLTGLWHGTGPDYILWGCYWGVIIICSTVFAGQIRSLDKKLHIDPSGKAWMVWQMIRTFLIYCGGRLLTAPGSLRASAGIVKAVFTRFGGRALIDGTLMTLGLDAANMVILLTAFVMIWVVDILNERGIVIRKKVAGLPLVIRWILYYLLIMTVVILGKYGAAYDSSAFIYAGF